MSQLPLDNMPPLLSLPEGERNPPIMTSRQWPQKRAWLLERLAPLLTWDLPPGLPLDPEIVSEEKREGHLLQKVLYRVEAREQVTAWLVQPLPATHRQPAVLCCHRDVAVGKDEPAGVTPSRFPAPMSELVKRGFVCLAPDATGFGERAEATPLEGTQRWAKMLSDHRRALDFLCHLDAVDSDRLAAVGHGFGAANALLLAAFDHRIKAASGADAYRSATEGGLPWLEVLALIAPRGLHYAFLADADAEQRRDEMVELGRLYDLLGCRDKFTSAEISPTWQAPTPRRDGYNLLKRTLQDGR